MGMMQKTMQKILWICLFWVFVQVENNQLSAKKIVLRLWRGRQGKAEQGRAGCLCSVILRAFTL